VIRAVLLDALGTLVRLEPPAPRLQASLSTRLGLHVSLDRCSAAMGAEMSYYGAHSARASDDAALALLRLECADVLADVLAAGPNGAELLPCLTDAISFTAFADAAPALDTLVLQGRRLAVVSNWDVSLPPVLRRLDLARRIETVVHSAGVGASKPDPRPFHVALERLALGADECVHVGDDPVNDGEGAAAAGLRAILVDRTPGAAGAAGDSVVGSLTEVPALLDLLEAA
jgi:putative hydrolase of the HAD superfamily